MNVFVETNFVLELVFQQEESAVCEQIFELAQQKTISLKIPAYSIIEPIEKLVRQKRERNDLQNRLNREIVQIRRNAADKERVGRIAAVDNLLIESNEQAVIRYRNWRKKLLEVAELIALTKDIYGKAIDYEQPPYDFELQDAIVMASVMSRLDSEPTVLSCFLNKNSRDFNTPTVRRLFKEYECHVIPNFTDGHRFIDARVS